MKGSEQQVTDYAKLQNLTISLMTFNDNTSNEVRHLKGNQNVFQIYLCLNQ